MGGGNSGIEYCALQRPMQSPVPARLLLSLCSVSATPSLRAAGSTIVRAYLHSSSETTPELML